ncbi:hypothetical protein HJD18_03375 [Thermoleophilia bacterium SCSIO 60948]|nr:hypothetical protein HJD18_03375 [Thermoleophilia bacterium SCSIO 60948]
MDTTDETLDPRHPALRRVEQASWDDIKAALYDAQEALTRALAASAKDLELWNREGEQLYGDEFLVETEESEAMSDRMNSAYIARHLKNAALALGMPRPGERPAWSDSPIGLVDGLAEDVG